MFYTRRSARINQNHSNQSGNQNKPTATKYSGCTTQTNLRQYQTQIYDKHQFKTQRFFHNKQTPQQGNQQPQQSNNQFQLQKTNREEQQQNKQSNAEPQQQTQQLEQQQKQDRTEQEQKQKQDRAEQEQQQKQDRADQQQQQKQERVEQKQQLNEKNKEENEQSNEKIKAEQKSLNEQNQNEQKPVQQQDQMELEEEKKTVQEKMEVDSQTSKPDVDTAATKTSATTKALNQLETDGGPKWKKGVKVPLSVRRQKLNHRLSRILAPKSALIILHQLKPGCVYKVQELMGSNPPLLVATVEYDNVILGTGQGMSKSQAKNTAAENAIKAIVSKTMTQKSVSVSKTEVDEEKMDEDNTDSSLNIPWVGLASFAMYKMFTEWQNQGMELPLARPMVKAKKKVPNKAPAAKKELPPNAAELHPSVLLNMMRPGVIATELERESGPKGRVTMGYTIDGQMYKGTARNRKEARKEAAKVVLSSLYGLIYAS